MGIRQRVKQFWSAVTAQVGINDQVFVANHLNSLEQVLFYQMGVPEQRHALNVAYTAQRIAGGGRHGADGLLLKACLLHDIGKRRGEITTLGKVIAVIVNSLSKPLAERLANGEGGQLSWWLHRVFYLQRNHPELGARLAAGIGVEAEVVELIRHHHRPRRPGDDWRLILLRRADELN